MLQKLMEDELKHRGVSARQAAREIGVAHTTVNRILAGKPIDLEPMEKVARWLNVDINVLLGQETGTSENKLAGQIALILQTEPALATVFEKVIDEIQQGNLEPDDLKEIIDYANYRISQRQKVKQASA